MKDVQQQGGPFEEQNVFVGLERQLTIDTTNDRILLHDGVKVGGFQFWNHDENLGAFQLRSIELDGIADAGWTSPMRGIPVRVGSGVYALRTMVGNNGVKATNTNGVAGNFTFALEQDLPGNHVAQGNWAFQGNVQSVNPIETDILGDSVGTHTGPVTGDVTGNLQGDSEGNHLGGLDARGSDLFLDDNQIPWAAVDSAGHIPPPIPTGCIVDWFGIASNVPAGWYICDGTNGTPDLRNRFVVCASDDLDPHSVGGSDSVVTAGTVSAAGAHSHNITTEDHILTVAEIPSHRHINGVTDNVPGDVFNLGAVAADPVTPNSIESNSADGTYNGYTSYIGGGTGHSHIADSEDAGEHTHAFLGATVESLPPFYALYKIMKG